MIKILDCVLDHQARESAVKCFSQKHNRMALNRNGFNHALHQLQRY